MKALLPTLCALVLVATPVHAQQGAPGDAPRAAPAKAAADTAKPTPPKSAEAARTKPAEAAKADDGESRAAPQKVTRWEDAGMSPVEAREWQTYAFKPEQAVEWKKGGFAPLVARTWSDKGFDADEAREWRDSRKNNHTLMADLDQSEPIQWKREGLTPQDRLAWWEAGFTFDDALLLIRAGMGPAEAAWHGQDKLKELKGKGGDSHASSADEGSRSEPLEVRQLVEKVRGIVEPYLHTGLIALIAFIAGGLLIFLLRRGERRSRRHDAADDAPDSEMPGAPSAPGPTPAAKPAGNAGEARRPGRRLALTRSDTPHCLYCKSTNVRPSRMRPHRFAGINFTDYFRCKHCGKHFAIVSYTPILAAGGAVVLLLALTTAGFIYLLSLVH